ncbi:MAG: type II toxin-antitoxin system HicB family antitoxin [Candidatus Nitrosocaldus sp.]
MSMNLTHAFDNNTQYASTVITTKIKSYTIILEQGLDGYIVVRCLELPVVTQGKDENEAIRNAIEAIELVIEELGINDRFNLIIRRLYTKI